MFALMHRRGIAPCGGAVFYLAEMPTPGTSISLEKALDAKGNPVKVNVSGVRIRCLSCDKPMLGAFKTVDVVEVH